MVKTINQDKYKVLTIGTHDALIDGDLIKDIPTRIAFVSSESELSAFTNEEPIGTIAALYGLSKLWQLTPAREWEEI